MQGRCTWNWLYKTGGAQERRLIIAQRFNAGLVCKYLAADADSLKKINAAVLGIFGGQDRGIPVEDVKKFEQILKQQGNKVEIVIYPDAGHAFENPSNKTGYRADDAADAWKHTSSFLAGTLKK